MGQIGDWLFKETFPRRAAELEAARMRLENERKWANEQIARVGDLLAEKTLELQSLKNKIVERAQTPTTIKAKTAAEIRRTVEQLNERELEEQNNVG